MNELTTSMELIECENNLLQALEQLRTKEENLSKELFNDLDDESFGAAFYTAKCADQDMRACVYFLKNEYNGLVKIGKTEDFPRRLKQIESWFYQCGLEPKLKPIMLHATFPEFLTQLENYYHHAFKKKRKYGEWFQVSDKKIADACEFGGEFEVINDTIMCFEEFEQLTMKKHPIEYDLESYIDSQISEPLLKSTLKDIAGIDPHQEQFLTILRPHNNTLDLLHMIQDKKLCVMVFQCPGIVTIGNTEVEPISFSRLKRDKFFKDYRYWENILSR